MTNSIQNILEVMKRNIDGKPYLQNGAGKQHPVSYRVARMHDPREDQLIAGKYRIRKRIGKGGMAVVYKAVQEPIEKVVALKILNRAHSGNELTVKRFYREAKTLARLKHRNILNIHDMGETEDGEPFFVMEYLEGTSLDKLIEERGAVPMARALPIFIQICRAMEAAHGQGIIHRDLKPANIMLCNQEAGKPEMVKLVDFGIVKINGQQRASQKLTLKGEIWGSPIYMSPEQCKGLELDARADIYSLAAVMYETLTGKPAFSGDSIGEIVKKQLMDPAPSFKEANPLLRIPEMLEQIVFKGLSKNADERQPEMSLLRADLESFAAKHGIKTAPSYTQEQNRPEKLQAKSESQRSGQIQTQAARFQATANAEPPPQIGFNASAQVDSKSQQAGFTAPEIARPAQRPEAEAIKIHDYGSSKAPVNQAPAMQKLLLLLAGVVLLSLIIAGSIALKNKFNLAAVHESGKKQDGSLPRSKNTGKEKSAASNENQKLKERKTETQTETEKPKSRALTDSQGSSSKSKAAPESSESGLDKNKSEKLPEKVPEKMPEQKAEKAAEKPEIKKASQQRTKVDKAVRKNKTAAPANPEADEAMLERIYLRKQRQDSTQRWLNIQEKESQ